MSTRLLASAGADARPACVLCFAVFIACGQSPDPGGGLVEESAERTVHELHWGYEGDIGPAHWADLSPDFARCGQGMEQSPIDLAGADVVDPRCARTRAPRPCLAGTVVYQYRAYRCARPPAASVTMQGPGWAYRFARGGSPNKWSRQVRQTRTPTT